MRWAIESQGHSGEGTLLDVSRTGARLQITADLSRTSGATFTLQAAAAPLLPRNARLRWFRRLPGRASTFLCGLVFFELGTNLQDWDDWLRAQFEQGEGEADASPVSSSQ